MLPRVPGLQYDIVKYELGPSIFVPIVTTQRMVGFIALTKEPTGDPFPDSAFSVARIAADTFALRLESDQQVSLDEMRMMLVQEREQRQALEDTLQEERGVPFRMSREIGNILDMAKGQPRGRSEAIAKLSLTLAENLQLPTEFLQEAVFLRDMGILARPIMDLSDTAQMPTDPDEVARDQANNGFEILSRIRLPSTCIEVARHHRENYDGTGVPDSLAGNNIPASARLVRIVEDYVNMTSGGNEDRPVLSPTVLSYLEREGGRAYDADMAETFAKIIRALGVTPEQETMSVIAHELRTPLAFLVGFSELLAARGDLPDQAKEMASELHKQTEQMVVLTERLLDLSRLQSGRVSLTYQWLDLKELIQEHITKAIASDRHTIRLDVPPQIVRARVDRTRLGQVVTNLLSNAIKYSPEGGRSLSRWKRRPTPLSSISQTRGSASRRTRWTGFSSRSTGCSHERRGK